jgi:hypothetical protein
LDYAIDNVKGACSMKPSVEKTATVSNEQAEFDRRIDERFAQERNDRELALVAQEHRLIPSLSNLISAFLTKDVEQRRRLLPKASTAVFWCLIPSSGTASVGIVALFSVFLAWQQTQLLNVQNQKIEVQNILSEAQRRSGLMFETSAIFQQIEEEKKVTGSDGSKVRCKDVANSYAGRPESCWIGKLGNNSGFLPSRSTAGRVAALTQALRPYRYLSVEDQGSYRFRNDEKSKDICPETVSAELLDYAVGALRQVVAGSEQHVVESEFRAIQAAMTKRITEVGDTSTADRLGGLVKRTIGRLSSEISSFAFIAGDSSNSSLSCRASSPERGQLLVALHAARIYIPYLTFEGADFRYADLPDARLRDIDLRGVDLSNAKLPGASFENAQLIGVNFSGSHLAGAKFRGATLKNVDFSGAIIQAGATQATNASLLFSKLTDSSLSGLRLIEYGATVPFFTRWCASRTLAVTLAQQNQKDWGANGDVFPRALENYALVTERRKSADGSSDTMLAVVVPKSLNKRQVLLEHSVNGGSADFVYAPFSECDEQ